MKHYYWWQISKTDIVSELHTVYNKGNTQCVPALEGAFFSSAEVLVAGLTEAIVGNGLLREINVYAGLYFLALWHQFVLIWQLSWFHEKMS